MTLQLSGNTYEAYESKVQVETEAGHLNVKRGGEGDKSNAQVETETGDLKVQVGIEAHESKVQVETEAIDSLNTGRRRCRILSSTYSIVLGL